MQKKEEEKKQEVIVPEIVDNIVDKNELSTEQQNLTEMANPDEMTRERKIYNNQDHFVAAILLKFNGMNEEQIAKTLGYSVRTIQRWFSGSSEAFSKEQFRTGVRIMIKVLPDCLKALEKSLTLSDRIDKSLADKPDSALDEKEWGRIMEGVKISSRRAEETIELINTVLTPASSKNIAIFGGEQHFGDKNSIVFTDLNDMAKKSAAIQRRIQKKLAEAMPDKKEENNGTDTGK
jgi:hypothetical protein